MPVAEELKQAEEWFNNPATLSKAAKAYNDILDKYQGKDDEDVKVKETAILKLGTIYQKENKATELAALIRSSRSFLASIPKAKTAKIGKYIQLDFNFLVKQLIDSFSGIPNSLPLQVDICKESIEWAVSEKRVFLQQSLETRLVALYLDNKLYTDALGLITTLMKELKRLDDRNVLMEVQLLESKAALTSARTSANSIYCPPLMQAALDMQSGILHAEEKDYKTAYSYFYETLESYGSQDDRRAVLALKYMLLCKIMLNLAEDVHAIVNGKIAIKYAGSDIDAMRAIANAHQNRSLSDFEAALSKFKEELGNDPIIRSHLTDLYDTLLEQNLLRIIEPFSKVEIAHVASLVKLPTSQVEAKLSQMILDNVFDGVLDQGKGCLVVFEEKALDKTYDATLDTIKHMGHVVESLYLKASKLS